MGRFGRQRSSKLIQFESRTVLLSLPFWLYAYFLSFPRYNDLLIENNRFSPFYPLHVTSEALARGVALGPIIKVCLVLCYRTLKTTWCYDISICLHSEPVPACDRQTDRQTDRRTDTLPVAKSRDKQTSWRVHKERISWYASVSASGVHHRHHHHHHHHVGPSLKIIYKLKAIVKASMQDKKAQSARTSAPNKIMLKIVHISRYIANC